MSQSRDYATYPKSSDEDGKDDIRHIEEVPNSEKGTASPTSNAYDAPRTSYNGRWGRVREFFMEPAIPMGEFITRYPNRWSRYREIIREPMAEFMGTMVLILIGVGVNCQVTLGQNPAVNPGANKGEYISTVVGWGAATACGVWVSGGISGGHINPAVTIAFATLRDFPWRKVPIFIFSQFMGAFVGASIIYGNYLGAIDLAEGGGGTRTIPGQFTGAAGTAGLFSTYALPYMTNIRCFFDEFLGTAILLIFIAGVTDQNNGPPPAGLLPLCIFFVIASIGAGLGMQTGYAINPARDFGPRVFTAMAGYGHHPFSFRDQYWIWCPILGPICGAVCGLLMYDIFLFLGRESVLNRPDARARRVHAQAVAAERTKPGITGVELV